MKAAQHLIKTRTLPQEYSAKFHKTSSNISNWQFGVSIAGSYVLGNACTESSAPFVLVLEDDVIPSRDYLVEIFKYLPVLQVCTTVIVVNLFQESSNWLFVKLWYTEYWWGWDVWNLSPLACGFGVACAAGYILLSIKLVYLLLCIPHYKPEVTVLLYHFTVYFRLLYTEQCWNVLCCWATALILNVS